MKLRYIASVASVLGAVLSFNIPYAAKANVADDLNANYNKVVDNCGDADKPGYLCSGNIVRLTGAATSYHVWDPSGKSLITKSISSTYLRRDISVNLGFQSRVAGIIYYPTMLKPLSKENTDVSCAFPMDGYTQNGRDQGCGRPDNNKRCQDLGIYTAEAWLANLDSLNANYQYQCGFDMSEGAKERSETFNANLQAAKQMYPRSGYPLPLYSTSPDDAVNKYNETVIPLWPLNTEKKFAEPDKLPLQAFFYLERGEESGLANAQHYQQDYFNETKIIIPIVKVSKDDNANFYFTYNAEDRGVTVADELNTSYNKIVSDCGSKESPAYECSGIVFRQTSYNSNTHVWDPSPVSIQSGGVSFAYMRKDIQFKTFLNASRRSGLIYYPSQQRSDGTDPVRASCIFPGTGNSNDRPYGRCGQASSFPKNSVECQQQGIYTADDWYKHLMSFGLDGFNLFQNQCGFDVSVSGHNTADAFMQSITAHNLVAANNAFGGTNELIIRTQDTDASGKSINPEKLPLQAFYYQNATGLTEAQSYQKDYYNTTGKIVPIVYMNTTDMNNITFSYFAADQGVSAASK